ncbi:MAG: Pathogenicity locus [Bacilli bacterium]|nr:Pathogenicity locus [Bacilli bacterium]
MKTELTTIPNVGKRTKQALENIGITCVEDLKGQDPEDLYLKDSIKKGFEEDKCQLYLLRMAVYYADHNMHEKEKLKWWYWKDKKYPEKKD